MGNRSYLASLKNDSRPNYTAVKFQHTLNHLLEEAQFFFIYVKIFILILVISLILMRTWYFSYRVIKKSVEKLIDELTIIESQYLAKEGKDRELFYYGVRESFNKNKTAIDFQRYNSEWIERAAQIVFLNHTCYNGLFRMNSRGDFNVPHGRYKRPYILNEDNLFCISEWLKKTKITNGDFTNCKKIVNGKTFVYFDPPYRPLNRTSGFTAYSRKGFSENDQLRLFALFKELDNCGAKIMLSNSDPTNHNPKDAFFDELFSDYFIERIPARRMINCNHKRRGSINELIITNYQVKT